MNESVNEDYILESFKTRPNRKDLDKERIDSVVLIDPINMPEIQIIKKKSFYSMFPMPC